MNTNKKTSSTIASTAGKVLQDQKSSKIQKQLAASVLAQTSSNKQTGSNIETTASKALNSDKYNSTTKSLAGSAVSQSNKKR